MTVIVKFRQIKNVFYVNGFDFFFWGGGGGGGEWGWAGGVVGYKNDFVSVLDQHGRLQCTDMDPYSLFRLC